MRSNKIQTLCISSLFTLLLVSAPFYWSGCAQGEGQESPDLRSPEEEIDRGFESSLAMLINETAEQIVKSFPGAGKHPSFRGGPIQEVELLIRTKSDYLESIRKHGILNQHNVQGSHSGGTNDPAWRLRAELGFIHIDPLSISVAEPSEFFPKYGFLNFKTDPLSGAKPKTFSFWTANHYGDIIFALKPYVRKRTTYKMWDSLAMPHKNPRNNEELDPLSDLTELLNFHKTGTGPWGTPPYIEYQTWGLLTLHQVREIWITQSLSSEILQTIDQIAKQYALKVFQVEPAPDDMGKGLDHELFQAKKTLISDYSSTPIHSTPDSYLDLAELERVYPTLTNEWEKAHVEAAFAMTKDAAVPPSMKFQVLDARKKKSEGLMKLVMGVPDSFLSPAAHAKILVDLIDAPSEKGWISQSDMDAFSQYLGSHPEVASEILKLKSPSSLLSALERIKMKGVIVKGLQPSIGTADSAG